MSTCVKNNFGFISHISGIVDNILCLEFPLSIIILLIIVKQIFITFSFDI